MPGDNATLNQTFIAGKQCTGRIHALAMFIRYPAWFSATRGFYNEIVSMDWALLFLDAAQIPDTYHMDGVSLRALAYHVVHRDAFMYEVWQENENSFHAS